MGERKPNHCTAEGFTPTPKGHNCTGRDEWRNSNEGKPKSHGRESLVWGFTLIEILLVVAIIGLLSSVVLIVYPRAFRKVKDSRVYSGMDQFRTQAFVVYENDESYKDLDCSISGAKCSCSNKVVEALCDEIQGNSDQPFEIWINNDEQGYCAVAHLEGREKFFCVDSSFQATTTDATPNNCKAACESANNCGCE